MLYTCLNTRSCEINFSSSLIAWNGPILFRVNSFILSCIKNSYEFINVSSESSITIFLSGLFSISTENLWSPLFLFSKWQKVLSYYLKSAGICDSFPLLTPNCEDIWRVSICEHLSKRCSRKSFRTFIFEPESYFSMRRLNWLRF